MTRLFQFAVTTVGLAFGLIVLGATDAPAWLHNIASILGAALIATTAVLSWITPGVSHRVRIAASIALGLLCVQGALAIVDRSARFSNNIQVIHIALALLIFAAMIMTVLLLAADTGDLRWIGQIAPRPGELNAERTFFWIASVAAFIMLVLIVSGTATRTSGASLACDAWPWCSGSATAPDDRSTWIDFSHRTTAIVGGLTIAFLFVQAMRRPVARSARRLAQIAGGATIVQILIGGGYVVTSGSDWLSAAHLVAAAVLWAAVVCLVAAALRLPEPIVQAVEVGTLAPGSVPFAFNSSIASTPNNAHSAATMSCSAAAATATINPGFLLPDLRASWTLAQDYIALTKPGIMSLLLATTLGGLLAGAAEIPPLGLIIATMIGGTLAAGGANALNCYIDRDIDALMSRTKKRGTVTGTIPPRAALIFGLTLTVSSVLVFGLFVNWLAAGLALLGNFYYVVVYTLWLKRRTPQNIVIGGAAGAMPPVVGWAAATGNVSIAAVLMFAIIYYWTPPHFWALALLKQGEYGRASVPMMPNVRGEEETRWQMLLYTIMLGAVALMLVPFGMGWIYLIGALATNGLFIWYAIRLYRSPSKALARRTFFYSLWYLFVLFAFMVADRLILA